MARQPDAGNSRESIISMRVNEEDRKEITALRNMSGDRSTSTMLRRLIREETARRRTGKLTA